MIEVPERTTGRRVRARVLGGFEVVIDDRPMTLADWRRTSAERLVKLLLVTPGHRMAREVAAETLWPGAPPGVSLARLRKALHFARRALAGCDLLDAGDAAVGIAPGKVDLDLDLLESAIDTLDARHRGPRHRRDDAALRIVLGLGEAELLPGDPYEDWLIAPRERLRARWQHLALELAKELTAAGRLDDAHALIERLLARDPTDEAAHRLAIEVFAAEGRHHAARRQYELCRAALRDHLDVEPSAATRAALARSLETTAPNGHAGRREGLLVGRHAEMRQLEAVVRRVEAGRLGAVLVRGPAGIGKTRILRELAGLARGAGWRVLEWQAVESLRTAAFAPLRLGLADDVRRAEVAAWDEPARSALATLLPGLGVGPAMTFRHRDALVTGLVLALDRLAADRPLMLAWDDLPWLDPPSLELLSRLLAAPGDRAALVAGTLRDEEPVPAAVDALLDQVRRSGGLDLALDPLDPRDVEPLVLTHLGGDGLAEGLESVLYDRSAGSPLFCLELLKAGRDRGVVRLEGGRWTLDRSTVLDEVPGTVRRLVDRRSAALPARARDVLAAAAELPPGMTFDLLRRVLGMETGPLMAALDEAIASGLLVEQPSGYAFAHPLFRVAIRRSAGRARRGPLHVAIAEALADVARHDPPERLSKAVLACPDPVAVAEHAVTAHELGSADATMLAVAAGFAAGHRQRELFDNAAAEVLLARSLAIWAELPAEAAGRIAASAAFADLGDIRTAAGQVEAATMAYRRAIATARNANDLARAYTSLYWLALEHGDFGAGLAILEEALELLPAEAAVARANVRRGIAWTLIRRRRFDEASDPLQASPEVLLAAGAQAGAMACFDAFGVLLRETGRIRESIDHLEHSLAIALAIRHAEGEAFARIHLGASLTRAGRFPLARRHLERATDLARLIGDRYLESVAALKDAELHDAAGDPPRAAIARRRELTLLAAIGGNAHNEAQAHAHLAVLAHAAGDVRSERREAREARRLARRSREASDVEWIDDLLRRQRWSEGRVSVPVRPQVP